MNTNNRMEQDMKRHTRISTAILASVLGIGALSAGCSAAPEPPHSAPSAESAAVGLSLQDARAWDASGRAKLQVTEVLARTTGLWQPDVVSDEVDAQTWSDPLVVEGDVPDLARRVNEAPNSTTVKVVSPVGGEPGTFILVVPEGVLRAVLAPR